MGMFDWYQPFPDLECPTCGALLKEWQGKHGPCGLFLWKQGFAAPIDQLVDEECRIGMEQLSQKRLPQEFEIYSYDCSSHQPVSALCKCVDGAWQETTLRSVCA